jgi:hypothetical protein
VVFCFGYCGGLSVDSFLSPGKTWRAALRRLTIK